MNSDLHPAAIRAASFSADGHDLFVVTDFFGKNQELIRLDADKPEMPARRLTSALHWDVTALAAAQDRGAPAAAAIAVDQGGYDRLYLLEPGTLTLMPVQMPPGVITALRFPTTKSDVMWLGLTSPSRPEDVYQLDVRTRRLTRWTRSELGPIDEGALFAPVAVSFKAGDRDVPALLYRPPVDQAKKLAVLIVRHGPLHARPRFNALAQLLAHELGIAVLIPANTEAPRAAAEVTRAQSEQELAAALDWIATQPDLDPSRVALLSPAGESAPPAPLAAKLRAQLAEPPPAPRESMEHQQLLDLLINLREKLLDLPPPQAAR